MPNKGNNSSPKKNQVKIQPTSCTTIKVTKNMRKNIKYDIRLLSCCQKMAGWRNNIRNEIPEVLCRTLSVCAVAALFCFIEFKKKITKQKVNVYLFFVFFLLAFNFILPFNLLD